MIQEQHTLVGATAQRGGADRVSAPGRRRQTTVILVAVGLVALVGILLAILARPPAPGPGPAPSTKGQYPVHTGIVSTTFWVGEIFSAKLSDGSQVCSTYDSQWAFHWSGINLGTFSQNDPGCPGSIFGGCDGVGSGTGNGFTCATEPRGAANGYFPKVAPKPLENPFYLDLPFDDLNNPIAFKERCQVIPWAAATNAALGVDHCGDAHFSYMKNAWVKITKGASVCYGQIEDAGPSSGTAYHDANYVFGSQDQRPANRKFNGAGMDVSPALNGCLGFKALNGDGDRVSWEFIEVKDVPAGPWRSIVTVSGVS